MALCPLRGVWGLNIHRQCYPVSKFIRRFWILILKTIVPCCVGCYMMATLLLEGLLPERIARLRKTCTRAATSHVLFPILMSYMAEGSPPGGPMGNDKGAPSLRLMAEIVPSCLPTIWAQLLRLCCNCTAFHINAIHVRHRVRRG